jgi:hypothetical protein
VLLLETHAGGGGVGEAESESLSQRAPYEAVFASESAGGHARATCSGRPRDVWQREESARRAEPWSCASL